MWRLHWATTGILRAFQAGRTACAKAERCGGIWCVLESIGTRVYVWVSGVWDRWDLTLHHMEESGLDPLGWEGSAEIGNHHGGSRALVPVAGATSENRLEGGARDFVFEKFSVWLWGASVSLSLNWGQSEMSRLPGKSFWLSNCRHSLILLPCLFQPSASWECWSEVTERPWKWLTSQRLRSAGVFALRPECGAQTWALLSARRCDLPF